MRALRTGIPLLHIKPESAYPALGVSAPPIQEVDPYPAHSPQANRHHRAKTAVPSRKQAHQKILEGHIHGSSSFHSMDMVPLRGSLAPVTQRKDRGEPHCGLIRAITAGRLQQQNLRRNAPYIHHHKKITPQPRVIFTSGKTGQGAGCNNPPIQPRGTKRQIGNACSGNLQGRIHHGAYMENPDAATYARPDSGTVGTDTGGRGASRAYLRNAEKAESHPFPRSGRPSTA